MSSSYANSLKRAFSNWFVEYNDLFHRETVRMWSRLQFMVSSESVKDVDEQIVELLTRGKDKKYCTLWPQLLKNAIRWSISSQSQASEDTITRVSTTSCITSSKATLPMFLIVFYVRLWVGHIDMCTETNTL